MVVADVVGVEVDVVDAAVVEMTVTAVVATVREGGDESNRVVIAPTPPSLPETAQDSLHVLVGTGVPSSRRP